MVGPLPLKMRSCLKVIVNRFGVIPKNHQPGKWWLIVDLSHLKGASVNGGIEKEICSLKYVSVDEALRAIVALGPGAKFDIENAYRLLPVHPDAGNEVERPAVCGCGSPLRTEVSTEDLQRSMHLSAAWGGPRAPLPG